MIRRVCLLAAVAACLALPSTSSAYWPYLGYGGGYGPFGWGWGFNQATNYVPSPPYYSVYPPVYYSPFITARQYGSSPFAWYPGMHPVNYASGDYEVAAPDPVIIENPWIKGKKTTSKTAETTKIVVQPLKIQNPFVVSVSTRR